MIRTVEQYLDSLQDGRRIYCLGKRVKDVTTHPIIRNVIRSACMDYFFPNDLKYKKLFVAKNQEGEEVNALFISPRSSEDLLKRREIFLTTWRTGGGTQLHCMGIDALEASKVVASRVDRNLGTSYMEKVENYRKYLQQNDLGITRAMTDAKGDRSLRPSKQERYQDYYVRVVDRQKDGIIVRGAKMHISSTPGANEAIVMPCRAHREEDKDYAVVFATPLNAKGITIIVSEPPMKEKGEAAAWDYPVTTAYGHGTSECMIVFDDVFVPWNRVFMCGEWQFTRDQAWMFGVFHRLFGTCHKVISTERIAGTAKLMAEYNGVDKYSHIQEKLAWLAMNTKLVDTLAQAACENPDLYPDIDLAAPNMAIINMAKFSFANNQHEANKVLSDIAGGLLCTVFNHKDWNNPEQRPYIEKYLAGVDGVPTEDRLKAIRLAKDLTGHWHDVLAIHAEGSLAAQKMSIYASADWDRYKAWAKKSAGIDGWQDHPSMKGLPEKNEWLIDE